MLVERRDSLLIVQRKRWDVISEIRFQTVTSDWLPFSYSYLLILINQDAMLWAVLWKVLRGNELRVPSVQNTERNWDPQLDSLQDNESCQQYWVSLEEDN